MVEGVADRKFNPMRILRSIFLRGYLDNNHLGGNTMFKRLSVFLVMLFFFCGGAWAGDNSFEIQMALQSGSALDESSVWFRMTMQDAGIVGTPEQVGPLNKIAWGQMDVWMKGYKIVGFSFPELANMKDIYESVRGGWGKVKSDKEDCWSGRVYRKGKGIDVLTWLENGQRFYMTPEGAKEIGVKK